MSWLVKQPIAHRGLHSGDARCPENSMRAFEAAIHEGFPIELDVQLLSDGSVVVIHDENTKRMTGVDRVVAVLDSRQITQMQMVDSDQRIPLLQEVLELVHGRVPLLIEIKNTGKVGKLENALLSTLSSYNWELAIQSFNPYSVRWFRVNAPLVERGQIATDFKNDNLSFYNKFLLKHLLLNRMSRPTFISYDVRYLPTWSTSRQRRKGLPILGWVVKSMEEHERMLPWCDNVIFEGFDPNTRLS